MNTSIYPSAKASYIHRQGVIRSFLAIQSEPAKERINSEAFNQMAAGHLPDLRELCLTLDGIMQDARAPKSAQELVPVLSALPVLDEIAIKILRKNPVTRHVLISGERYEVVLNHWKPGKASDIHGHPSGGCLFKLLYGKVEEVRYTPEIFPKVLGFTSYRTGNLGYIDNDTAFHQVGNPYGRSAASIHIYLKN